MKRSFTRCALSLMALLAAVTVFLCVPGHALAAEDYAPRQLLVKFKEGRSAHALEEIGAVMPGARRIRQMRDLHQMELPEGISVEQAMYVYRSMADVEYVEPNYIRRAHGTPSDTYFAKQWGLNTTGSGISTDYGTLVPANDADIDAPEAWDFISGSSSFVIGVIDSGVDYYHSDLSANIWHNPGETSCTDGVDNDTNGYIDDCYGWDFVDDDNTPLDPLGHGTHVSGIIGARGNNSLGISGVMQYAQIMPLRFMDDSGSGTVADSVSAIYYAIDKGVRVLNASYGGTSTSISEFTAISAFCDSGGIFVGAAGNETRDNDAIPDYPSSFALDCIISVAGTDPYDQLLYFSNYGATSVDLGAPGYFIYSTLPSWGTVWSEDFEHGLTGWTSGGNNSSWGTDVFGSSTALADSPGGNYADNTDSWTISPSIDLTNHNECVLSYDLYFKGGGYPDTFYVEASSDGTAWTSLKSTSTSILTATTYTHSLAGLEQSPMQIRLRMYSDGATTADGAYIDNMNIQCMSQKSSDGLYDFESGTSMSAPIVTGVVGLVLSANSALTSAEVKYIVLNTGDAKSTLTTTTVSGRRVNAYKAVMETLSPGSVIGNETPPTSTPANQGCFIATAAYGSPAERHVEALRIFRDRYLIKNPAGRWFVNTYYRLSPPVADYISTRPALRAAVRAALEPVAHAIEHPVAAGCLFAFILAPCGAAAIRTLRRRKH